MSPRPMTNARRALLRTCYICLIPTSSYLVYFEHDEWCPKKRAMERVPPELRPVFDDSGMEFQ